MDLIYYTILFNPGEEMCYYIKLFTDKGYHSYCVEREIRRMIINKKIYILNNRLYAEEEGCNKESL